MDRTIKHPKRAAKLHTHLLQYELPVCPPLTRSLPPLATPLGGLTEQPAVLCSVDVSAQGRE